MQSRWRSKLAWISVLPLLLLMGDVYGFWNLIGMPKDEFSRMFCMVMNVLVAFGIFNNPTDKEGY
jgi:uncharacterized membrane protein